MTDMNTVPIVGTFQDVANAANNNFQALKTAVDTLEVSSYHSKGYFSSESALTSAWPSPKVGDWAVVGGYIYRCATAGTWTNTEEAWTAGNTEVIQGLIDASVVKDATPTNGSTNLVESGGVWTELNDMVSYTMEVRQSWTVTWRGVIGTASSSYWISLYEAPKSMSVCLTFTRNDSFSNDGRVFILNNISELVAGNTVTLLKQFTVNTTETYNASLTTGQVLCVTTRASDVYSLTASKSVKETISEMQTEIDSINSMPVVTGKNLYDASTVEVGLLSSSGVDSTRTSFVTSAKIAVKPNTSYTLSAQQRTPHNFAEYQNASATTATSVTTVSTNPQTFTTSATTYYLRVCCLAAVGGTMLEEGSTQSNFEGYMPLLLGEHNGRQVHANEDISVTIGKNIFDLSAFTNIGYYNGSEYKTNSSFRYTARLIAIKPNTTYIRTSTSGYLTMRYYDINQQFISNDYDISDQTFTTPSGAYYAEISVAVSMLATPYYMIYEGNTLPASFVPYDYGEAVTVLKGEFSAHMLASEREHLKTNRWGGKKYISLGDSITARDQWQKILDFYTGMTHDNNGWSGRQVGAFTFIHEDDTATGILSAETLASYDLIIVGGYANCAYANSGMGKPLGAITDEFIEISEENATEYGGYPALMYAVDAQSFIGQCQSTIEYLSRIAPTVPVIGFGGLQMCSTAMLPGDETQTDSSINFQKKNYYNLSNRDYSDAFKEVCNYYGIPFVDLERNGGVNKSNYASYYGNSDYIHPLFFSFKGGYDYPDSGMKKMAVAILKEIV